MTEREQALEVNVGFTPVVTRAGSRVHWAETWPADQTLCGLVGISRALGLNRNMPACGACERSYRAKARTAVTS